MPSRALSISVVLTLPLLCVAGEGGRTKEAYVHAVTRGAGLMPWQAAGMSEEEETFRAGIEARKDALLAGRVTVTHPAMLDAGDLALARENIAAADWARKWFDGHLELAGYLADQSEGCVDALIEELTPASTYGFTCPNCVGTKSQEAAGPSLFKWQRERPDVIECKRCGQTYPDERFPETARLVCPRGGQTLTFYVNETEREHSDDRSGAHAYHWVGHPVHVSFAGAARARKAGFAMRGLESLAYAYAITEDARYARVGIRILARLARCYRNWMYHDYWGGFADCDPMYAAWHDRNLRIEWKRHLCEQAFAKDALDKAGMMQSYWGAGRYHPSTDSVSALAGVCLAYDLLHDASGADGAALWTPERRAMVERDLILEWIMGAEPFVGGPGKAECVNNKAPRIYRSQAAVAACLGLPEYADTALRGYQALRDRSFLYDGFTHESPAYTNMYLSSLIWVPETLHGFQWPESYEDRSGVVDLYVADPKLELMYRSVADQPGPRGYYLPLSDTRVRNRPGLQIVEIGMKRYPEYFAGRHCAHRDEGSPSGYAVFHIKASEFEHAPSTSLPEIVYPAWMTAIFRNGAPPDASVLAFVFNPPGGHRHLDNLSLYYADRGHAILGDLGYVGDMPVNSWIKSTRSHNLVVVDGADQKHRDRQPRLHLAATSPVVSVVEASSNAYAQCSMYRRLVALIKGPEGRTFAIDIFRVKGGKTHAYRAFSGLASSASANGSLNFERVAMPPEPPLAEVGQSLRREDIFGLRDVRTVGDPPASWQAVWRQDDAAYRLWMLSQVDAVEAANGPGQTTREDAGRRVRYLNAVRKGDEIQSTFVAVHEPSAEGAVMPIRRAERLDTPEAAGPDAVAVRIESEWGTHFVFNEFAAEAEVAGIRFEGTFGVVSQGRWLFALGASTLQCGELGFERQAATWTGGVQEGTGTVMTAVPSRPAGWPPPRAGFRNHVIVNDGAHWTGFPIEGTEKDAIRVTRFALPKVSAFKVLALRFMHAAGCEGPTWQ